MSEGFAFEPPPGIAPELGAVGMYRAVDSFLRGALHARASDRYSVADVTTIHGMRIVSLLVFGSPIARAVEDQPCIEVFGYRMPCDDRPVMAVYRCLGFAEHPRKIPGGAMFWRSPPLLLPAWRAWRSRQ